MGTSLLAEWSHHSNESKYALEAGRNILLLHQHLLKTEASNNEDKFILQHGYNARTNHHSCCKWARGIYREALT